MFSFWPYYLSALLMLSMPLALGWWIAKKRPARWGLFLIGVVTFIGSQILHVPFNWVVMQQLQLLPNDATIIVNRIILALFMGLSAGVFEEGARYLTYRFWAKDARTWGRGLMLGAGHGGIESMLVGLSVGLNAIVLAGLTQGLFQGVVPAEQSALVEAQIAAMQAAPWYLVMLGALERVFALCAHLAMSLLVMQVFIRRQIAWLGAAILWHTLLNAVAVFAISTWDVYVTEALVGVMALFSVGIIFWLRTPEPVEPALEPLPPLAPFMPSQVVANEEKLDQSKYS